VVIYGFGEGRGRVKLQDGDEYTVATSCCHDLWPCMWPLQMPFLASVQPPTKRPLQGATSSFITISKPSGLIPGGREGGRLWSSNHGGRLLGLVTFLLVSPGSYVLKIRTML
jgi:hypothetical protein